MKSILAIIVIVAAFALSTPRLHAGPDDSLLDHMAGDWLLTGTITGNKVTHDVSAEWILNHEYLRLHEVSRGKSPNGSPDYEAMVFFGWDESAREYTCLWLDTTSGAGLNSPTIGRGKPSGDQIPFLFKSHDSTFHNTFVYDPSSATWQWIMDGEENGKLVPFARLTLSRK